MPPKKAPPAPNYFPEVMAFLLALFLLMQIWDRLQYSADYPSLWSRFLLFISKYIWPLVMVIGAILIVIAMIGIFYAWAKLKALADKEKEKFGHKEAAKLDSTAVDSAKNEKWQKVLEHINSTNSSDWRLAIIEADIMLDDLLKAQGRHGDSIGDKLKGVEPSDFLSLDAAWEAHKVRNQIAHSGADYVLSERDAKRVIALYESVFREFQVI